jgi:hypothetical protein
METLCSAPSTAKKYDDLFYSIFLFYFILLVPCAASHTKEASRASRYFAGGAHVMYTVGCICLNTVCIAARITHGFLTENGRFSSN